MQRKINKVLALVLSIIMVMSIVTSVSVFAKTIAEGTCGDELTWVLDNDGRLTINGYGDMDSYYYYNAPWYSLRKNIYYVVVNKNVESISNYAFRDCTNLTNVIILNDYIDIYGNPFTDCNQNLVISGNIAEDTYSIAKNFATSRGYIYKQHKHDYLLNVTPATIISAGISEKFCSSCGAKGDVDVTPKLPCKIAIEAKSGVTVIYGIDSFKNDIDVITKENKEIVKYFEKMYTRSFGIDISAKVFSVSVQPAEDVYIKVPVSYDYTMNKISVYYFKDSASEAVRLECVPEDNSICFFAPAFGTFLIVDESSKQEPVDLRATCTCKCHKSGFENFIWKIGNFFARLFGISKKQFCACGDNHWADKKTNTEEVETTVYNYSNIA